MRSLPIPQPDPSGLRTLIPYNQIAHNGGSLGDIVSDLTGGRVNPTDPVASRNHCLSGGDALSGGVTLYITRRP